MAKVGAQRAAYFGFRLDGITVEPEQGRVVRPDGPVTLSPKAMDVLLTLVEADGKVVSAAELLERTWGQPDHDHGVLVHAIGELRHALNDSPRCPRFIQTIRGVGYRLRMPVRYDVDEAPPPSPASGKDVVAIRPDFAASSPPKRFFLSSTMLRLTATYAVTSWVLIQVLELLLPLFYVADWVLKLVLLVMIAGYPAVVLFAWFKAFRGGRGSASAMSRKERWTVLALDLSILAVLSLCVGALSVWLTDTVMQESAQQDVIAPPEASMQIPHAKMNHQSVLVVPFQAVGKEVVPSYFLGLVHDELLQSMADNPGVSPISNRAAASVSRDETLQNLKKRLGVRWVVEGKLSQGGEPGSVQARIQLADTLTNEIVWSDTILGNTSNLLSMQERLQNRLLAALTLWVPGAGDAGPPAMKTSNVEAFEAFLRGVSLERYDRSPSNLDASIRWLNKARQLDPAFMDAAAHLCKNHVRKYENTLDVADFSKAKANCDLLSTDAPENRLAGMSLARLFLAAGQFDEAAGVLRTLSAEKPSDPELLVLKAKLASARGDHALARALFEKAIAAEPGYAGNYHEYGVMLYQQGDFDGAFQQFNKEVMLRPNASGPWNSLGVIFFYKGQFADAENAYRRSVELEPSAGNYSNLASLYFARKRFEEAATAYRHAISLRPGDPRMWLNWGDALQYLPGAEDKKIEAYGQAARLLKNGLRLRPNDLDMSSMLMHAEAGLGRCHQAMQVLSQLPSSVSQWTHDTAYYRALVHVRCSKRAVAETAILDLIALGYPRGALMEDIQFDAYKALIAGAALAPDNPEGAKP